MSAPTPRFWRYESRGASHPIMSFGTEGEQSVLIVPPLLEELNRTRKLVSDIMRALVVENIATHLPDLPGTGESETALDNIGWDEWREAVREAAAACGATAVVAIRGGCLLDGEVAGLPRFRLSPVEGKRLIRDLIRSRSLTDPEFDTAAQKAVFTDGPTTIGGYPVSSGLACAFRDAEISGDQDVRTVRLENEHGDADTVIAGPPLWRRAEPSGSPALAAALAADIRDWLG